MKVYFWKVIFFIDEKISSFRFTYIESWISIEENEYIFIILIRCVNLKFLFVKKFKYLFE